MTVGLLSVGCFEDPGPISGDGESGETGEVPTHCWCATVTDAEVDPAQGPAFAIEDPLNGNGSPRACLGADIDVHGDLTTIHPTSAVVTGAHSGDLIAFRDQVFDAAEARCDDLADAQGGGGSTNDCYSILIDGTSPLDRAPDEVCMMEGGQVAPDHWSDYYRLSMVIVPNPTNGIYEIDEAFYDDMLENPWWIAHDNGYIALNSTSDFAFFNVQSGDLIYELGIRSGDVPQTLNSLDVTSMFEAITAYNALINDTEFEFVVQRPGVGSVTLDYAVVP